MAANFDTSITKENLMRAFAGESQARNRYTIAAEQAIDQNLYVLSEVFTFTANQEAQHAKVFYDYLKPFGGQTIEIDGTYPVDISESMATLLGYAQHNEYAEYNDIYKNFSKIAHDEGFDSIANTFSMIAEIEKTHGDRFGQFEQWLEANELFRSETETAWMCLNCGHIHYGTSAPMMCPVCHHDQGYFIRLNYAPWTK